MTKFFLETLTFSPSDLMTGTRRDGPQNRFRHLAVTFKYGVPVVLFTLAACVNSSVAQEKYMPPTYRQTQMVAPLNPNWTPTDQVFDAGSGEAPLEPAHPFFDIDWSVLLSATHTGGTDVGKNFVTLTPEISLTHLGLRGQYAFDAKSTFSVNDDQLTRVNDGELGYTGSHQLDSVTLFNSSASFQVSQDDVNAPGVASNIKQTPYETVLQGELGIVRQFGKISVDGRANAQRQYRTDTQLLGDLAMSNAERNLSQAGASLRLSYAFSPEIALFVQGDASRDWYDAAPVSTGIKLDGTNYTITMGGAINWRDVLDVELTAGYLMRQHVDPSLANREEAVYGINAEYTPNDDLTFTGELTTTINRPDVTAALLASTEYNAIGTITYGVAPWLDISMTQTGNWIHPEIGVNTQTRYSTGFGAEAALNKNLSVNLNYVYSWAEVLPTDDDPEWQHAATIGIRYSR